MPGSAFIINGLPDNIMNYEHRYDSGVDAVNLKWWWRHEMETLSALAWLVALCVGNLFHTAGHFWEEHAQPLVDSPHKGPAMQDFDVFFVVSMLHQVIII